MPQPKVLIQKSKGKKKGWYVIVKGRNGKVLMTSEILSSVRNAKNNMYAAYNALVAVYDGEIKLIEL